MVRLVGRQVKGIIINNNDKKKCIVASERRKAQVRQKIACAREKERGVKKYTHINGWKEDSCYTATCDKAGCVGAGVKQKICIFPFFSYGVMVSPGNR